MCINVIFTSSSYNMTEESNSYSIKLIASYDIDNNRRFVNVLNPAIRLPAPTCSRRRKRSLPGDGTILGFIDHVGGIVGSRAVQLVLLKLNVDVSISIYTFAFWCHINVKHLYFGA